MKITKLTKYGNSMGVRIPKAMLEQSGLSGEVMIEAREGKIIIATPRPRSDWEAHFAAMARAGDDKLILPDNAATEWDKTDWRW